ncbi:MAG: signal peptidase I [Dehalococcoidia bacterium]|nr:signal peptidase I [Dehalococcoidia bacterium]
MAQVTTPPPAKTRVSPVIRTFARETLETVLLALGLFLLLRVSIQNFRVVGSSMEPNIHSGEYVFVNKLAYVGIPWGKIAAALPFVSAPKDTMLYPLGFPKRGDVFVFHAPGGQARDYLKRVIGLPGDLVSIEQGTVYVNGTPLDESYKHPDARTFPQVVVPLGQLFVLGDNRPGSNDSRFWGTISTEAIIGRVWVRYWPPSKATFISREPSPLGSAGFVYADTSEQ